MNADANELDELLNIVATLPSETQCLLLPRINALADLCAHRRVVKGIVQNLLKDTRQSVRNLVLDLDKLWALLGD